MQQTPDLRSSAGLLLGLLLLSACGPKSPVGDDDDSTPPAAQGPCDGFGPAEPGPLVGDAGLNEISGIVASRLNPGLLWVIVDSGGPPVITALRAADGTSAGSITLLETNNQDWEDLALGPCGPTDDSSCLYVGDIGDNGASRQNAAVLRLPEPTVADQDGFALEQTPIRLPFRYPGGPHDAEALVVESSGLPTILTKRNDGTATLQRFPALLPDQEVELETLGAIITGEDGSGGLLVTATAADLLPGDERLIVRSYGRLWEFDLGSGGLDAAPSATRKRLEPAAEFQGEAVAYDAGGQGIWHVSEGARPPLYFLACTGS